MAFNGLLFCTACGNLLPRATKAQTPHINCDVCSTSNTNDWPDKSTTTSRRTDYPSALQRKRDNFATLPISQEVAAAQQLANEECPQCLNPQMMFSEAQLRGADEGSTVFYTCPKCDHKFNTNN